MNWKVALILLATVALGYLTWLFVGISRFDGSGVYIQRHNNVVQVLILKADGISTHFVDFGNGETKTSNGTWKKIGSNIAITKYITSAACPKYSSDANSVRTIHPDTTPGRNARIHWCVDAGSSYDLKRVSN